MIWCGIMIFFTILFDVPLLEHMLHFLTFQFFWYLRVFFFLSCFCRISQTIVPNHPVYCMLLKPYKGELSFIVNCHQFACPFPLGKVRHICPPEEWKNKNKKNYGNLLYWVLILDCRLYNIYVQKEFVMLSISFIPLFHCGFIVPHSCHNFLCFVMYLHFIWRLI